MDTRSKHVFAETNSGEVIHDLNHVIWQVWHELGGQVPRPRIRQVAMQVAAGFRNATVTTYIPLYIRHLTREWLKEEIRRKPIRHRSRDVDTDFLNSVKATAFEQKKGDKT
jgi:hypothetical protein